MRVKVSEHPFWFVTMSRAEYVESKTPLLVSVHTGELPLLFLLHEEPERLRRQLLNTKLLPKLDREVLFSTREYGVQPLVGAVKAARG